MSAVIKPKKCRVCRRPFIPARPLQSCCQYSCAITYSRGSGARQSAATKRVRAAEKRELREKLKTKRDWMKEAQAEFNKFIRERDYGKPCICCGKYPTSADAGLRGHLWDAGHYRSVGAAGHLRFNEDNCHRQLVQCNRDRSGNAVEYRIRLIERIGLERVEALEHDNTIRRFDIASLKSVIYTYRAKAKALKAAREGMVAA